MSSTGHSHQSRRLLASAWLQCQGQLSDRDTAERGVSRRAETGLDPQDPHPPAGQKPKAREASPYSHRPGRLKPLGLVRQVSEAGPGGVFL